MSRTELQLELVCPEFVLTFDEIVMAVIPGLEGDFGVLPRHAPMISILRPGVLELHMSNKVNKRIFVRDGFAEVLAGNVVVLAEDIVMLEDLDREKLAQQIQNASEDVADARDEKTMEHARNALDRLKQIERAVGTG